MTPISLADDVRRSLAALPTLHTPAVRAIRRKYATRLAHESGSTVLRFTNALLAGGGWPARVVAWEVLGGHRAAFASLDDHQVDRMARGLADWGSVDLYGCTVVGQAWREGFVSDRLILSWVKSPDRWRRRLALVATVPLNIRSRGGTGDAKRTLRICRLLLDDRDDMVVKAMSWALRELAKQDPKPVAAFLRSEDARLAARVKREVSHKLTTGLKSPRRP